MACHLWVSRFGLSRFEAGRAAGLLAKGLILLRRFFCGFGSLFKVGSFMQSLYVYILYIYIYLYIKYMKKVVV